MVIGAGVVATALDWLEEVSGVFGADLASFDLFFFREVDAFAVFFPLAVFGVAPGCPAAVTDGALEEVFAGRVEAVPGLT
jgi:hypothetical protein